MHRVWLQVPYAISSFSFIIKSPGSQNTLFLVLQATGFWKVTSFGDISHNAPRWSSRFYHLSQLPIFPTWSHKSCLLPALPFLPPCSFFLQEQSLFLRLDVQTSCWLGLWLQRRRMWPEKNIWDVIICFENVQRDMAGFDSLWGLKMFFQKYWWLFIKRKHKYHETASPTPHNIKSKYIVNTFLSGFFWKHVHVNQIT